MPSILDNIDTIVLLMFENRSFDHMLGHLSLEGINPSVNGYRDPKYIYDNIYKGGNYSIYEFGGDRELPFDLPHEWDYVATQLSQSSVSGRYTMTGFVEAYAKATGIEPNDLTEPMAYFNSIHVPITSFLAKNFCVCDNWFASLPTSTQPNRTIAFSGDSHIHETRNGLMTINDNNIFEWLDRAQINKWRVYHDGLSFFALYSNLWGYVLGENFTQYENLAADIQNESDDTFPQLIIVEPSYESGPHIGSDRPNDNHAPLAIGWGEEFLRRTYQAITSNPARWAKTLMIVYYDEHGGFYDHVSPPPIKYRTIANPSHQFDSLGVRIPGIIISPFINPGSVCHSLFDHTSVLQLLAEKFTPGQSYSTSVDVRSKQNPKIESISAALTNESPWLLPDTPTQYINVNTALGKTIATAPSEPINQSFEQAALQLIEQHPDKVKDKFPELFQWKDAVSRSRS